MSSVENNVPYQPNAQGFVEVLLDYKSTFPSPIVFKVTGYVTTTFEDVSQGDGHLVVSLKDVAEDYSTLPTQLIESGFKLTLFREEDVNLESAFMALTRGVGAKI